MANDNEEPALPAVRVRCAGVRANQRHSAVSQGGRVFFSEAQYAASPFLVRVSFDCVTFLHRGTHVVERRFTFPGRVLHAVLADFSPHVSSASSSGGSGGSRSSRRQRKAPISPQTHPHLCVLVRSDCLNVYTAAGEVFEVALPFQANRLFPMESGRGLLLQRSPAVQIPSTPSKRPRGDAAAVLSRKNRRASTSNRGDGDRYNYSSSRTARPRYFTLRHPLDEVKPVALEVKRGVLPRQEKAEEAFLSDSALEAVAVLDDGPSPVLVAFHKWEQRFCVFRMTKTATKHFSTPQVRVVDGPTWTRYRLKSELEEFRARIEPDWTATLLWKSPRVGASTSKPMFLSSICSQPSPLDSSPVPLSPQLSTPMLALPGNISKVAFIASDTDGLPLICMMDKDAGILLLRPLSQQKDAMDVYDEDTKETNRCRVLHCRDAVPIRQENQSWLLNRGQEQHMKGPTDIVVLRKDGNLVLHRAHHPVCRLVLPCVGKYDSTDVTPAEEDSERVRLVGNVQLFSVDAGSAYEILYPDLCGTLSGKIWRCEHPLKVVSFPLLQQVFEVLDCIIPSQILLSFKATVVHRSQYRSRNTTEKEELGSGVYEWQSFCDCALDILSLHSGGQGEKPISVDTRMPMGDEDMGVAASCVSSFDALCQSEYHDVYQYEHALLFATMELPATQFLKRNTSNYNNGSWKAARVPEEEGLQSMHEYAETMFAGLHLLCEDLKLSIALFRPRLLLANLLLDIAIRLGLDLFIAYYEQDSCILKRQPNSFRSVVQQKTREEGLLRFSTYGCVPDLIQWVECRMRLDDQGVREFPMLLSTVPHVLPQQQLRSDNVLWRHEGSLWRTQAICRIYELLFPTPEENQRTAHSDQLQSQSTYKLMAYLTQDPIGSALSLVDLPVGLGFPIVQAIRQVKHHPPPFITEDICVFVGREDLSIARANDLADHLDFAHTVQNQRTHEPADKAGEAVPGEDESHEDGDGLDEIITRSQPLFPIDQRMKEVSRLLRSSRPLCLKLEKQADLSDLDYAQQQQARLLLLCKRSMALSVARGMVTLGSFDISAAQTQVWQLRVPALPLAGRKPPANAIVELDLSGYAKELTYWPQFHNGCATGLRLPAHDLSGVINRHWIKYHRPSVGGAMQRYSAGSPGTRQFSTAQSTDAAGRNLEEAYASHAGLLLGIGLRGHLKCLSMADVYNYLSLSNEFVTVAIMLGMASTAAHCRRKRKQQKATAKPGSEGNAQKLQSHSLAPSASPESVDDELPPLDADHLFSGFPELSSSDKTPLLGTGLELALERSVSKMLCLHVPSLLPPPFAGFSVPASTQTAALLGLGILYQGTGYRLMTELLLTEIARSPSSAQFLGNNSNVGLSTVSFNQLEGYSLAAGMALGLVVLGRGQASTGDPGLADLKLEEKLHRYIVGGAQQYRDTNAAGSCLYRGRRWQAFGSGGSLNSTINGNSTGNGPTNGSNGASPGAGRDAKHTHDRNNLRGGGEHVNIGVTACGSALALAFMYMQTSNKAVAAQLKVPDTLILLDYVRPDILLVRTLAKNLVLWDEISPTTQWIEQHEVPAQLLQSYKSIQPQASGTGHDTNRPPNGSPSHTDLHSICESYANIVAGACMSIGLRFAGTGNAPARATLRKYVLHFRELRTKASSSSSTMILRGSSNVVAAATERATVERCLAVCAQALALVDAGTGNVETLTLLRSVTLRQRVDPAMTYGNHMALSMAIGLLFLGGGRATVSRSKEAIAALVISLYPMVPMNTADNKYHLQAFRHLYVLAVDTSRLLETVDVNTQMNCAVKVHVDLLPDNDREAISSDRQPMFQVLRTPCLLPDIASIKRLAIHDPDFYPVEILSTLSDDAERPSPNSEKRTANTLRLKLLRNTNAVFLKRRQRKDIGDLADFTNELQLLHIQHAGPHGNNNDDRLLSLFRSYFAISNSTEDDDCEDGEDELNQLDVADWGTGWWSSQLSPCALQPVLEEAHLLLPSYLNALHALFRLQQVPHLACATEVIALSLFCNYCRFHSPLLLEMPSPKGEHTNMGDSKISSRSGILEKKSAFVDFGVWLSNQTEEALRALWHRSSLSITSLASARVQLLVEPTLSAHSIGSSTVLPKTESAFDKFLVDVMLRYFAGPSVFSMSTTGQQHYADKDWKTKFQRVLAACSQAEASSTYATSSLARFQLGTFLYQCELTEAEKTFWLKLISFFLFSN